MIVCGDYTMLQMYTNFSFCSFLATVWVKNQGMDGKWSGIFGLQECLFCKSDCF